MEELESEAGPEAIEAIKKKDMYKPDGGEYEYKDRRQEIVFIGHNLNQAAIEELLNKCLLDDEEMALGPGLFIWVYLYNQISFLHEFMV